MGKASYLIRIKLWLFPFSQEIEIKHSIAHTTTFLWEIKFNESNLHNCLIIFEQDVLICALFFRCAGISCVQFDDTRIVSGSSDKTIKVSHFSLCEHMNLVIN